LRIGFVDAGRFTVLALAIGGVAVGGFGVASGIGEGFDVRVTVIAASVRKPDGTVLLAPRGSGTNCTIAGTTLPGTGTYSVLLDPDGAESGSLTFTLTNE
jgi:hypothetical protein